MQGYLGDHPNASDNRCPVSTLVSTAQSYISPIFIGYSNEAVPLVESDEVFWQVIVRNCVQHNGLFYVEGQEVLDRFPCSTAFVFTHRDI